MPILLPVMFLIVFAPVNLFFTWQRRLRLRRMKLFEPIPSSLFNISKLVMVFLIIVSNVALLIHELYRKDKDIYPSTYIDIWCPALNILDYIVLGIIIHLYRVLGLRSSGVVFIFSFLSFTFLLSTIHMRVMSFLDPGWLSLIDDHQKIFYWTQIETVLFSIHFFGQTVLFALNFFPDLGIINNKVTTIDRQSSLRNGSSSVRAEVKGIKSKLVLKKYDMPDMKASFLSKISYHWFTPMVLKGFRKELTLNNIWQLRPKDSTNQIAPFVDRAWMHQFGITSQDLSLHYDHSAEFPSPEKFIKNVPPGTEFQGQIVTTLIRAFGWSFLQGAMFKLLHDSVQFISPFLLK